MIHLELKLYIILYIYFLLGNKDIVLALIKAEIRMLNRKLQNFMQIIGDIFTHYIQLYKNS